MSKKSLVVVWLLVVSITGCTKPGKRISPEAAAEILRKYEQDFQLKKEDVEVLKVNEYGEHAVAEVKVTTAFRFLKTPQGWKLQEIRTPDGQWQRLDLLERALDQIKTQETRNDLSRLARAIDLFRQDRGSLPPARDIVELNDLLVPQFIPAVVRTDLWSSELVFEARGTSYRLASPGPDRKTGTADDIEISG